MINQNKPYNDFTSYLSKSFPFKVQKISINAGFSCPNRDGTKGRGGCTYCNNKSFSPEYSVCAKSITEQLKEGIEFFSHKYSEMKYLAYFQSYTNTYAPLPYLESLFTEAISLPEICALSIGTRPDCLPDETVELLARLNQIKPVWVELGLQTIHEKTAEFIRRGYPLSVFEDAYRRLKAAGLTVIVHVILGLPDETKEDMLDTVRYLADLHIDGIKLQLLHVLKGTDLDVIYQSGAFRTMELEEYLELVGDCLKLLPQDIVIHRVSGDGPKSILTAPLWSGNKRLVLNSMAKYLRENEVWQGMDVGKQREV